MVNEVTQSANQDRYMKCASCKATASRILVPEGVTITVPRGPVDERVQVTTAAAISTCERHLPLNLRRAQTLESVVK
jgi:hypothetical protein